MNTIYRAIGISKQAFHQRLGLQFRYEEECEQLLPIINSIRENHPVMSAREMYHMIKPTTMGRDRFEAYCFEKGFKVEIKRSFQKTTNSLGVTRFDNQIIGLELTGINQVWVSDITYYRIGNRFYYLTFIMDLYSRRILGFNASKYLFTEDTTIPALKMAIKERKGIDLQGLIFHSDGGGQYYCKDFLALTKPKIINSMCESVYENAHAERVNGTIKNAYLEGYNPQNFEELKKMLIKAVFMYNHQKPHKALNSNAPIGFEKQLLKKLSTKMEVINKRKKVTKKEKNTTNTNMVIN